MSNSYVILLFFMSTALFAKYKGHGAESLDQKILDTFAPKPVDESLQLRIGKALDIRSPGSGLLSPNGNTLYFTWNVTGTRQLWKSSKSNAFPVQLTAGEDRVRVEKISSSGQWLMITRDAGGSEYVKLYLLNTQTQQSQFVFGKKKVKVWPSHFSQDGETIYFMANATSPKDYSFYEHHISSGKTKLLFTKKGVWWIEDHWGDERWLLGQAKGNISRSYEFYDLKSKKFTKLFGGDEQQYYSAAFLTKNKLVVKTNKFGEFHQLYTWSLNSPFKLIHKPIEFDISRFSLSKDRSRLLYTINEHGYFRLRGVDTRAFKVLKKVPEFKGADSVYIGEGGYKSRYRVFRASFPTRPSEPWVYDWQTGKSMRWIVPSTPEFSPMKVVKAELESYPARDGTKIPMFVYRPQACKKKTCPVIVSFHGGPEGQSTPYFSALRQIFLEQGYVFVLPNVRGSRGYGKSWLDADNIEKRLNVISDIADIGLYIKKHWAYSGQQPKVGVMGGSYGGYSTLLAMTKFSGVYDAGVSIVGMSNLVTFLENTAPYRKKLRTSEYGDPEKDLNVLQQLSPMTYLDKTKDPLMIIQGANDPRVPAGEAVQIYEALKKKNIVAELLLFADEGHGITKRKNRVLYYGHLIKFMNQHLLGKAKGMTN